MKILKIYPHIYPLSTKQNVSIVSASLPFVEKSSHNFKIISPYTSNPMVNSNIVFIDRADCFIENNPNTALWNVDNSINYIKYLNTIYKIITAEKPDLIEVEFSIDLACDISKHIKNIPTILVNHINIVKSSPLKNIRNAFKIRNIAGFIFVAKYFKNQFVKLFPFYKNKSYVVHNSYAHVANLTNSTTNIEKDNQIIFLGKGTIRKGIKEYLEALSIFLQSQEGSTWKAMAICAIEKEKEQKILNSLKEIPLIEKALLSGRLIIKENIPYSEAFKFLQKSKIAVFPTIPKLHQEGTPMVALEAAMAKCLIISSTSGGYPELNPFVETLLFKISPEEILNKIKFFVNNKEQWQSSQEKQFHFIINNFNIKHLAKSFDNARTKIVQQYQNKLRKPT